MFKSLKRIGIRVSPGAVLDSLHIVVMKMEIKKKKYIYL